MRSIITSLAIISVAAPSISIGSAEPIPGVSRGLTSAPQTNWTGLYGGLQVETYTGEFTSTVSPLIADAEGELFGLFAGYRYDLGNFVAGGEIDYLSGSITQSNAFASVDGDVDALFRVGAEVGYDLTDLLVYGSAGYFEMEFSVPGIILSADGAFYGLGADYSISERVTLGAEVLFHDINGFDTQPTTNLDFTSVGLNAAFRF